MNIARIWKCPQCGGTEEIGYDWLAERGGPVCDKCDCDMELQAEAADDRAAIVERLLDKADAAGLQAEDLDEMVGVWRSFGNSLPKNRIEVSVAQQVRSITYRDRSILLQ